MKPDWPGTPSADLPAMLAALALLSTGPAIYAWKLSRTFTQQFGMQFRAGPAIAATLRRAGASELISLELCGLRPRLLAQAQ